MALVGMLVQELSAAAAAADAADDEDPAYSSDSEESSAYALLLAEPQLQMQAPAESWALNATRATATTTVLRYAISGASCVTQASLLYSW